MTSVLSSSDLQNKIHTIRGVQVMLDSDLAQLYGVETKNLNRAAKRNIERFPQHFMFQLTQEESDFLRCHFVTSKNQKGGRRYLPYVFTEQGVSMLSAILKSKTAVSISIQIIEAFVSMRKFISKNADIFFRLDSLEKKQFLHDQHFERVFKALNNHVPKQGIFYDGQVFDAFKFVSELIRSAQKSIILVDNYVDESTLALLAKKKPSVEVTIYSASNNQLRLDINKFNSQYGTLSFQPFNKSHDRFLIIDDKIYHFGASLKDLGKKWFAFSKFDRTALKLLEKLSC